MSEVQAAGSKPRGAKKAGVPNAACHPDGCGGLRASADQQIPFTGWCVCVAAPHMPAWQQWGITANMLSVAGLLTRLAAAAFIAWGRRPVVTPLVVFILAMSGIWFDNIDGSYARNYGEPSTFGAYLDVGSDIATTLALGAAVAYRAKRAFSPCVSTMVVAALVVLAGLLAAMSAVGCTVSRDQVAPSDPLSYAYYLRSDAVCGSEPLRVFLNPETLGALLVTVGCAAWLLHDVVQLTRGRISWSRK